MPVLGSLPPCTRAPLLGVEAEGEAMTLSNSTQLFLVGVIFTILASAAVMAIAHVIGVLIGCASTHNLLFALGVIFILIASAAALAAADIISTMGSWKED